VRHPGSAPPHSTDAGHVSFEVGTIFAKELNEQFSIFQHGTGAVCIKSSERYT
jgi:hypothetical protein